jgi:hypothetical protein
VPLACDKDDDEDKKDDENPGESGDLVAAEGNTLTGTLGGESWKLINGGFYRQDYDKERPRVELTFLAVDEKAACYGEEKRRWYDTRFLKLTVPAAVGKYSLADRYEGENGGNKIYGNYYYYDGEKDTDETGWIFESSTTLAIELTAVSDDKVEGRITADSKDGGLQLNGDFILPKCTYGDYDD